MKEKWILNLGHRQNIWLFFKKDGNFFKGLLGSGPWDRKFFNGCSPGRYTQYQLNFIVFGHTTTSVSVDIYCEAVFTGMHPLEKLVVYRIQKMFKLRGTDPNYIFQFKPWESHKTHSNIVISWLPSSPVSTHQIHNSTTKVTQEKLGILGIYNN